MDASKGEYSHAHETDKMRATETQRHRDINPIIDMGPQTVQLSRISPLPSCQGMALMIPVDPRTHTCSAHKASTRARDL